jgi:flagellar hook-associated protein 3 FlgL
MRISTPLAFERAIEGINDRQSALVRTQQELSTGRKLLEAGDDPMGAAEAERTRSQIRRVEIQQRMNDFAKNMLGQADATLAQVNEVLQSLREGFVQAANGSLSTSDRALLARQFQGYRDELLVLANRADGAGGFVFGGQGSTTAPFTTSGTIQYNAAAGEQQVGLDTNSPTMLDGRENFMNVPTASGPQSIFAILDSAISVLSNVSATTPAQQAAATSALQGVDGMLDKVQMTRTEVGENLKSIDSRGQLAEDSSIEMKSRLSQLVDLDFAKAMSDFSTNQTALQAAMKSYTEIAKMSLFSYI